MHIFKIYNGATSPGAACICCASWQNFAKFSCYTALFSVIVAKFDLFSFLLYSLPLSRSLFEFSMQLVVTYGFYIVSPSVYITANYN